MLIMAGSEACQLVLRRGTTALVRPAVSQNGIAPSPHVFMLLCQRFARQACQFGGSTPNASTPRCARRKYFDTGGPGIYSRSERLIERSQSPSLFAAILFQAFLVRYRSRSESAADIDRHQRIAPAQLRRRPVRSVLPTHPSLSFQ